MLGMLAIGFIARRVDPRIHVVPEKVVGKKKL